jgi:hypothetical protein
MELSIFVFVTFVISYMVKKLYIYFLPLYSCNEGGGSIHMTNIPWSFLKQI